MKLGAMFARPKPSPSGRLCLLAAIVPFALSGARAEAQELCVTCEQPFTVYRCAFDDHSPIRVTAPGAPLACAKQLAQRRGHSRCSIRRNSSGPCEGELVVIIPPADTPLAPPPDVATIGDPGMPSGGNSAVPGAVPGLAPAPAPSEPLAPVGNSGDAADGEALEPEQPSGPPKTVEELAKQTAKSSEKGLKDAGEAVAGAAKKTGETIGEAGSAIGKAAKSTWKCLSTLFSDC